MVVTASWKSHLSWGMLSWDYSGRHTLVFPLFSFLELFFGPFLDCCPSQLLRILEDEQLYCVSDRPWLGCSFLQKPHPLGLFLQFTSYFPNMSRTPPTCDPGLHFFQHEIRSFCVFSHISLLKLKEVNLSCFDQLYIIVTKCQNKTAQRVNYLFQCLTSESSVQIPWLLILDLQSSRKPW